jgi:GH15 family glucan-1,4-alpha-glucosidase
VRIGNAAVHQRQLDIFGEVIDALYVARCRGIPADAAAWQLERHLMEFLERVWREPDEGIWEVRGPRRQFTHSKVMAWVAFDRAVKAVERFGLEGPVDRWRAARAAIHDEVCRLGWDAARGTFTQFYGSRELDASLLRLPLLGFLPISDPRVVATVGAIERELVTHGLVARYSMGSGTPAIDGLPAGEGAFLLCTFWLADCFDLMGRHDEARALFERLLGLRNDLGLLSEEYDPVAGRMLGNFPQAFSHVGLINTALNLATSHGPAQQRGSAATDSA